MGPSMELPRTARRLVSQSLVKVKEVKKGKRISCDKSAGGLV